eukprot:COSAG02_NODE_12134_length_1591_cov_2.824397_3_plen_40_part_00
MRPHSSPAVVAPPPPPLPLVVAGQAGGLAGLDSTGLDCE